MDSIKVIFLDFDGVLNSDEYRMFRPPFDGNMRHDTPEREDYDLDKAAIRRVNRLVELTKAMVVISSMWRLVRTRVELQHVLTRNGFIGTVLDKTPHLSDKPRGLELKAYLHNTIRNIESWVAIDDRRHEFKPFGSNRLVLTTKERGLLDEHVDLCLPILKKPWRRQ